MIDGVWPAWNGTRLICGGCGRRAPLIDRGVAVEMIEDLVDRLFRLCTDGRVVPGSAVDTVLTVTAAQVRRTVSGLDTHLRDLSPLGGPSRPRSAVPTQRPPSAADPTLARRSGIFDCAARVAWTIATMADSRWRDRSTDDGICPAELFWTAIHNAAHAVEDVELCLPRDERRGPATATAPTTGALVA